MTKRNKCWQLDKRTSKTTNHQHGICNSGAEVQNLSIRQNGGSLLLYIQTTEITKFFDRIKDNVKMIKGLEKTFYGATEFSIEDNNGYLLTFTKDEK